MKFDVIVGNPPFIARSTIHLKFVRLSQGLLKKDGYLGVILPTSWMRSEGGSGLFNRYNLILVDTGSTLFSQFNVGTGFSYIICQNSDPTDLTNIITHTDEFKIGTKDILWYPEDINFISTSISKKISSKSNSKFNFFNSDLHYVNVKSISDDEYKFKIFDATDPTSDYFTSTPNMKSFDRKIAIPLHGYDFIVDELCTPLNGRWSVLRLDENESCESARSFFNCKLMKWVKDNRPGKVPNRRINPFFLNYISRIDLSRVWTDQEIYNEFNLTQDEIDYIEKLYP